MHLYSVTDRPADAAFEAAVAQKGDSEIEWPEQKR